MSSLSLLYAELREKQNELERLQHCQSKLGETQREFMANERLCLSPELSAKTWQGTLARAFDVIRTKGILSNYQDLEHHQLNAALSIVSAKMEEIRNEIISIEAAIQAEIARMNEKES